MYSGPLFIPETKDGKKYIKYEVIGIHNVAVPTHLFKVIHIIHQVIVFLIQVILAERDKYKAVACFIMPNESIPATKPLIK